MTTDRKRAQKAADKKKKREKRLREQRAQTRAAQQGSAKRELLGHSADLAVAECVVSKGWQERGLAHLLVARQSPGGDLLVGGFLVDTWCLGLRDTVILPGISAEDYENRVKTGLFHDPVEFEPCPPGVARALVEGAIGYAEQFGFQPNKRWPESRRVFAGLEAKPKGLSFGRQGRPCLVKRPGLQTAALERRLERSAGPGNFDVVDEKEL